MVLHTNVYPSNQDHFQTFLLLRKSKYLLKEMEKEILKKSIVFS